MQINKQGYRITEAIMNNYKILAINPGSTSTKISVFTNDKEVFTETIRHTTEELSGFETIAEQEGFRSEVIKNSLEKSGVELSELDAISVRGGLLKPIEGGTYTVNASMLSDLKVGVSGQHASNLGGLIANEISKEYNIPAFIVDPVVVDELEPIARISGHKDFERKSIFHALNQKAVARIVANDLGKSYDELNLIVVHMGGGISVGAHKKGKVVDVNNALHGEGPFSPERSGTLPFGQLIELCATSQYQANKLMKMFVGNGGLKSYLGTSDCVEVRERIENGDEFADVVFEAMAYQIAKEIGAASAVLFGKVDAIVLTGGIAYSEMFVKKITDRINFIAKCLVIPGEDEMAALAQGAYRVLNGIEDSKEY